MNIPSSRSDIDPSSISISSNADEEIHRVLAALSTVFNISTSTATSTSTSTSTKSREAADRYLTQFQRSSIAWVVADRLLSSNSASSNDINNNNTTASNNTTQDIQVHFFAAQTLHTKCRADILQLDPAQFPSLRESLMNFLLLNLQKKSTGSATHAIVTRLAMALSCLAVQMNWDTIMDDLLANLTNSPLQQQPQMMQLVLSVAKILPEEANSERLLLTNEQQRHTFVQKMTLQAEQILSFLFYCASNSPETKVREQVLRCLHSWIRYVNIRPQLLQQTQLIDFTFAILQAHDFNTYSGDLFDLAVDVIIELLRCYPSNRRENMGLVHKFIPLVMALGYDVHSPFRKAVLEEDEDGMRDYCRIFTEMGESYMSLIMSHEDLNQVQLVDLVLACSAIPDNEIATITLFFWCRFVTWLEDMEPYEYRQLQIDNFTPQIIQLVSTCIHLLKYPTDVESLADDRIDDIHKNRSYVDDTLGDCCRLLGGDLVLKNVGTILQTEVERVSSLGNQGLQEWHTIEACFKALISTSRYIPNDESAVLPFVMRLIPTLPTSVSYLRNAANFMVGAFAQWLNRHSEQLHPILPFLAQGLSEAKCASSAAVAIKQLCECCSAQFSLGDSVLQLYDGIIAAQVQQQQQQQQTNQSAPALVMDLKDELEVLEGACKAVSRQLQEMAKGQQNVSDSIYISRIVEPIGSRLVQYSSTHHALSAHKQVIAEVERLTVVIRHLHVPNGRQQFLIDLMTQCWPYLESISIQHTDFRMAENLCRLHKHCLRNCGAVAYAPLLERLCSHLVKAYSHSRQSPYLYAASIVIAEYGKGASDIIAHQLYRMLEELGKISFCILNPMDQFKNHPDIVEELFFLAGRMIQFCPDIFVGSKTFDSFVQCAKIGMVQPHKDANRGTMSFLDNALDYGIAMHSSPGGGGNASAFENFGNVLSREGKLISMNLIFSLIGELPYYQVASTSSSGSISGLLYKMFKLCPGLLLEWISIPLARVGDTERALLMNGFRSDVGRADFFDVCERFVEVCSRTQKMGGI